MGLGEGGKGGRVGREDLVAQEELGDEVGDGVGLQGLHGGFSRICWKYYKVRIEKYAIFKRKMILTIKIRT